MWTFFAEITQQSTFSIVGRSDLIRKIKIPRWIIIVSVTISALVNFFLNLLIVGIFMVFNKVEPSLSILLFPLLMLELYLFSLGISLWLATLYVKYRDVSYIWEILMQGLFYLTPIIYPLSLIKKTWMQQIILLSPVAQTIQGSRYALISHETITFTKVFPSPAYLLIPLGIVAVILITGVRYFKKESKYFAENI